MQLQCVMISLLSSVWAIYLHAINLDINFAGNSITSVKTHIVD